MFYFKMYFLSMIKAFKRPVSQIERVTYRSVELSRLNLNDKLFDFRSYSVIVRVSFDFVKVENILKRV